MSSERKLLIDTLLVFRPDVAYFILTLDSRCRRYKRCVKWETQESETIDPECKYVFIKECYNQLVMSVPAEVLKILTWSVFQLVGFFHLYTAVSMYLNRTHTSLRDRTGARRP